MAGTDSLASSQQQKTSTSPQTASDTALPSEQASPSAQDVLPLFDIIEACLEEFSALRELMPSRHAEACVMTDSGLEYSISSSEWKARIDYNLDHLSRKEHAVLIIEDIDASWFQVLAARFPASLDVRFLAQHVLRQGELKATYFHREFMYDSYRTLVSRVDAEIWRRLPHSYDPRNFRSRHIDGQILRTIANVGQVQVTNVPEHCYRNETLSKLGDSLALRKISTRLSYCHLHKNLTLVLVDAGPQLAGALQVGHNLELWPAHEFGHVVPLDFVSGLFRHYTVASVFAGPVVGKFEIMLVTAAYQVLVPILEMRLLEWRQRAAEVDNEQAFSMLTKFRRGLADIHQSMAKASDSGLIDLSWLDGSANQEEKPSAQQSKTSAADNMLDTSKDAKPNRPSVPISQTPESADLSKLSETFSELDARLRAIIAALNDDIQIVIGSVQIRDAKAMMRQADLTMQLTESTMRQTEVSVRQAQWTVALAILAAFCLPMTLVTGIYGMNIKEISGDKGPSWWWVVVTWAITMGITVGCAGRYALIEWQWYRQEMEESKAAAKQDLTKGTIPGEQDHGMVESARN